MKWSCSGTVYPEGELYGHGCENAADYVITIVGHEESAWDAKQGRCQECLDEEFPNGEGLSFLMPVAEYNFKDVPYNATNIVDNRIIYKTTDYPFHAQV